MIQVTGIPAFNDNYLWVIHDDRYAVIVDPGDAVPVIRFLQRQGLELAAILITHHHADHVGGIDDLLAFHSVPVFGPRREDIDGITHRVSEPDQITLPHLGITLQVLDVPGHTRGHIAYHGNGWVFCGDTLFACGCGRLFEGTAEQMAVSLEKLAHLPGDTAVYCAHEYTLANIAFARTVEPNNDRLARRAEEASELRQRGLPTVPSRISLELETNPFLRCHEADVREAVATHTGTRPTDAVAVFAALRQWKNTF
jgi:hydroxyacylglutathione hydrolase